MKRAVYFVLFCLLISSSVYAQSPSQIDQMKAYLDSPAGKKFLQSPEGKQLAQQYAKTGNTKDAQAAKNYAAEMTAFGETANSEEAGDKIEPLSDIELAMSKDLLMNDRQPLRQYGYKVFRSSGQSFMPQESAPASVDYLIGPGDSFNVTLWGITEGIFKVTVDGEGNITLPKVGVISVAGLHYGELKSYIEDQLRKYYESVNVGITLDQMRTIKVYVVGEVERPGSYSISSLSTVYSALFEAGGPTKMGSMRKVQLIRNGNVVANVDLYKFLLYGDKGLDRNLQSGDTVFVPVIGPVVAVAGSVYRPGIYEFKGTADLADVIALAGGFLPTSYLNRVQVKRLIAHERRVIRDENVNLDRAAKSYGLTLSGMDFVEVFPLYENIANLVYVEGEAKYPGSYELKDGMKVKDLLPDAAAFIPSAFMPHVEIIRTNPESRKISILPVDFQGLYGGDETTNLELKPLDRIVVAAEKRKIGRVVMSGEVLRPGIYTIAPGEKLSSVLTRAGGFTGDAYLYGAKFTRKSVKDAQELSSQKLIAGLEQELVVQSRDIAAGGKGEKEAAAAQSQLEQSKKILDILKKQTSEGRVIISLKYPIEEFAKSEYDISLEDGDELNVPTVSGVVMILGEVYSPRAVVYRDNKSVDYYLSQVGGVTENANQNGIYVIRSDGSVLSSRHTRILSAKLMPGDAIVVPQYLERTNSWAMIQDWTHWFYEAVLAYAVLSNALR